MPPDEPTSVALAHIDGRLDTLTQTVGTVPQAVPI